MQTCSFATLVQMHATCPPRPSDTGPYTLICLAPPIQAPSTGRPRCPAGQQAWLSSLQEPLSCNAATAADLVCLRLCMIIAGGEWRYDLLLGSKDHMDGWQGNPFTGFGNMTERWCCHVVQPSQYCIYWIPFAAVLEIFRCIVCSYKIVHFHTNYSSYHIVQFWMC